MNGICGDISPPAASASALKEYALVDPSNEVDMTNARLELMTSLVQILSKNKRVGWEIDVRELVKG